MQNPVNRLGLPAILSALLGIAAPLQAADTYAIDPVHSSVTFKVSHTGLSFVHGRFNEFAGSFTTDTDDAGKWSFAMTIKPESIDTNNKARDEHLRGADFFDVKKFPSMEFKSTSVRPVKDGYSVTGDFTLRGMTKPVSFTLKGGKKGEFPKGVQRTGFSTEFTLKRSEFGMDKFTDAIGDEVHVAISFQGMKK